MSGDWIKMRAGLDTSIAVFRISQATGEPPDGVIAELYRLASWFHRSGKYGKLVADNDTIDLFCETPGFAHQLELAGWLESHGDVRCLRFFCDVSAGRKSLGRKVRDQVLSGAVCAACGTAERLCIDHIVPVVRGGSCEVENLQALCHPCNSKKGRKTMAEFMAEVSP